MNNKQRDKHVGTCTSMCSLDEIRLRTETKSLDTLEIIPRTELEGVPQTDMSRAVKKYPRAAADGTVDVTKLRPPKVLIRTQKYLESLTTLNDQPFKVINSFLSDRFRAIRKDILQQELSNKKVLSLLERQVYFHCISIPLLNDSNVSNQNFMMLKQSLISFFDAYNKKKRRSNFRVKDILICLYLLVHADEHGYNLRKSFLRKWKNLIANRPLLVLTLKLLNLIKHSQFMAISRLFNQTDWDTIDNTHLLLIKSISDRYFFDLRGNAVTTFCSSTNIKRKSYKIRASIFKTLFSFETDDEVIGIAQHYNMSCSSGVIDLTDFIPSENWPPISHSVSINRSEVFNLVTGVDEYSEIILPNNFVKEETNKGTVFRDLDSVSFEAKQKKQEKSEQSPLKMKEKPRKKITLSMLSKKTEDYRNLSEEDSEEEEEVLQTPKQNKNKTNKNSEKWSTTAFSRFMGGKSKPKQAVGSPINVLLSTAPVLTPSAKVAAVKPKISLYDTVKTDPVEVERKKTVQTPKKIVLTPKKIEMLPKKVVEPRKEEEPKKEVDRSSFLRVGNPFMTKKIEVSKKSDSSKNRVSMTKKTLSLSKKSISQSKSSGKVSTLMAPKAATVADIKKHQTKTFNWNTKGFVFNPFKVNINAESRSRTISADATKAQAVEEHTPRRKKVVLKKKTVEVELNLWSKVLDRFSDNFFPIQLITHNLAAINRFFGIEVGEDNEDVVKHQSKEAYICFAHRTVPQKDVPLFVVDGSVDSATLESIDYCCDSPTVLLVNCEIEQKRYTKTRFFSINAFDESTLEVIQSFVGTCSLCHLKKLTFSDFLFYFSEYSDFQNIEVDNFNVMTALTNIRKKLERLRKFLSTMKNFSMGGSKHIVLHNWISLRNRVNLSIFGSRMNLKFVLDGLREMSPQYGDSIGNSMRKYCLRVKKLGYFDGKDFLDTCVSLSSTQEKGKFIFRRIMEYVESSAIVVVSE
ncbi:hypothetical protein PCE1_000546 [Barthelona sp. PCE]